MATALLLSSLLGSSVGCAEGAGPFGDVPGTGGSGVPAGGATFTRVWTEVLAAKGCNNAVCHGAMPAAGELALTDMDTAFFNLVNAKAAGAACKSSPLLRVKAGDPDMSLLVQKMNNAVPSCGTVMPPGAGVGAACTMPAPATCNTTADIELVRAWISAGAPK